MQKGEKMSAWFDRAERRENGASSLCGVIAFCKTDTTRN